MVMNIVLLNNKKLVISEWHEDLPESLVMITSRVYMQNTQFLTDNWELERQVWRLLAMQVKSSDWL